MRTSVAILLCCFLDAVSTLSEPSSVKKWKGSFGKEPSDCKNKLSNSICEKYSIHCEDSPSLRKYCAKTCATCRAISPVPCKQMPFGCCWDGTTFALGPAQRGCPECVDKHPKCYKYATKKNCEKTSTVKNICPASCGLCSGCQDNPEQREFCPTFKKSGFCETMKGNMKNLCRKTCNLCGPI